MPVVAKYPSQVTCIGAFRSSIDISRSWQELLQFARLCGGNKGLRHELKDKPAMDLRDLCLWHNRCRLHRKKTGSLRSPLNFPILAGLSQQEIRRCG